MDEFTTTSRTPVYAATAGDLYEEARKAAVAFAGPGGTVQAIELENASRATTTARWGATAVLTVSIPVEPFAVV